MVSLLEKMQKEKELLSTPTPKVSLQEGILYTEQIHLTYF